MQCWSTDKSHLLLSSSVLNRPGPATLVRQRVDLKYVLCVLCVNIIKILVLQGLAKPLFCLTSPLSNVAEVR